MVLVVKKLPAKEGDAGDACLIPEWGRSPGGGHGNPLQCSCLENLMDRGAWRATVHRIAKNRTQLKLLACTYVNEERVGESGEVNGDSDRLLKVKAAQSSPTLCDSMDCSPPGVPGILQARILE